MIIAAHFLAPDFADAEVARDWHAEMEETFPASDESVRRRELHGDSYALLSTEDDRELPLTSFAGAALSIVAKGNFLSFRLFAREAGQPASRREARMRINRPDAARSESRTAQILELVTRSPFGPLIGAGALDARLSAASLDVVGVFAALGFENLPAWEAPAPDVEKPAPQTTSEMDMDCVSITRSEDANERLVRPLHGDPRGRSAALGRLISHFPRHLVRSADFWRQLAGSEENPFREDILALAETISSAGFTLVLHTRNQQGRFRKEFGMEPWRKNGFSANRVLSAEVFVDLPCLKQISSPLEKQLAGWLVDGRQTGSIVRCNPDGTWRWRPFLDGLEGPATDLQSEGLTSAARDLWPRACFAGLGLPDLLEPGDWMPSLDDLLPSFPDGMDRAQVKRTTAALEQAGIATVVAGSFDQILDPWPEELRPSGDGQIHLGLALQVNATDPVWYQVSQDLKHVLQGGTWIENGLLRAWGEDPVSAQDLADILAELPESSFLRIHVEGDACHEWYLRDLPQWNHVRTTLMPVEDTGRPAEVVSGIFKLSNQPRPLLLDRPELHRISPDDSIVDEIIRKQDGRTWATINLASEALNPGHRLLELNHQMASVGFRHLTDVYCSEMDDVILRAYGRDRTQPGVEGVVILPLQGEPSFEFFTRMEDGRILLTATRREFDVNAERGLLFQEVDPDSRIEEILGCHEDRVEAEGSRTVAATQSLESFVAAWDEFLNRALAKAA